jgi:hypothetical protein
VPPRVVVDAREHARRHRDVDLLGRAEIALDWRLDHRPDPAGQLRVGLVLGQRARRGQIGAVFGEHRAVRLDRLAGVVKGLFERVAGRVATRQVGHDHAPGGVGSAGFDGDQQPHADGSSFEPGWLAGIFPRDANLPQHPWREMVQEFQ